ncbi:MAG: hypothetical protein HYU66_28450, partial [Armatimonadetes bacterium]|nr:hypothetical protein [Armatimonadota bacterium]
MSAHAADSPSGWALVCRSRELAEETRSPAGLAWHRLVEGFEQPWETPDDRVAERFRLACRLAGVQPQRGEAALRSAVRRALEYAAHAAARLRCHAALEKLAARDAEWFGHERVLPDGGALLRGVARLDPERLGGAEAQVGGLVEILAELRRAPLEPRAEPGGEPATGAAGWLGRQARTALIWSRLAMGDRAGGRRLLTDDVRDTWPARLAGAVAEESALPAEARACWWEHVAWRAARSLDAV